MHKEHQAVFDISGKVAVVTGATGGFGKIACTTLAKAGAKVMATGRNEKQLKALVDDLKAAGGAAAYAVGDPVIHDDVKKIIQSAVDTFGGVDILITAAGVNKSVPMLDQPVEEWENIQNVNVKGTYLFCKEAGRQMVKQGRGGKMLLVSSARGAQGMALYTAYSPSKAAVNLLTKSLACEWGQYKINVNAVAPTVFRTALTQWMFDDSNFYMKFLTRIPIGRLGEPEDFIGLILYLCSSASDFMTGSIIALDGGYSAG